MSKKVAIIGGGVSGITSALILGKLGLDVTLFERKKTLISGPPFCHLHAGGNLYREISDEQCITLLEQSIDFAKLYPQSIDKRPTVIALPSDDPQEPQMLFRRLELLRAMYKEMVRKQPDCAILGESDNYFELFSKEQIIELSKEPEARHPKNNREWLIPFAKNVDIKSIKFPVIVVQEYGINLFSVGASAGLALESMPNVRVYREYEVTNVQRDKNSFTLEASSYIGEFDYLINSCGFQTGVIDDMLGVKEKRMVEFKAAFTSLWSQRSPYWPEIIFHGERGTPRGMGQFTPYCGGFVQLHAMTQDITLCKECLVKTTQQSSYPKLGTHLLKTIESGWESDEYKIRTKRAIAYLAKFLPKFKEAKVGGIPLYGAQQIPGVDPTLRVAEVAFPKKNYARCEIVKVSSAVDMVAEIIKNMQECSLLDEHPTAEFTLDEIKSLKREDIENRAQKIAQTLGYPLEMSRVCNPL